MNGTMNGTMTKQEEKIVQAIIVNGLKTLDGYTKETGISKRTISRIFIALQKKEIIQRIGSKHDGY